jgi:PilZ domain
MTMEWPGNETVDDSVVLRGMKRDSMFLKASLYLRRTEHRFDIVVRNISAGGMLADTPQELGNGDLVIVTLRKVGDVPGRVVWSQGKRFGVAFDVAIEPTLVRTPVTAPKQRTVATVGRRPAMGRNIL